MVCASGDRDLPPAPSPQTCLQGAEQSTGLETGRLAAEDRSIVSIDSLSTNCVGSKAKQEKKPRGRETVLAALALWLAQPSYLPAAPSPECPFLRPLALLRHAPIPLLLSNVSHLKGWTLKNPAKELEPVCITQPQQSSVGTSLCCPCVLPGRAQPPQSPAKGKGSPVVSKSLEGSGDLDTLKDPQRDGASDLHNPAGLTPSKAPTHRGGGGQR